MSTTADPLDDLFRQAMRRLATTVALVTAGQRGDCTGMAATAVMSVTAAPPTIAVAVNRNASLAPILARDRRFCVNLLADRHRGLVHIFSGGKKGAERFADDDWSFPPDEAPILIDAAASLICDATSTIDVGTHTLVLGTVRRIVNHPLIDPLVWVDGGFARLHAEPQTAER